MHDPSFRAIARCPRCELTQYRPDHGRCRRCGWSLPRGSSHFAIRMPGFANAIAGESATRRSPGRATAAYAPRPRTKPAATGASYRLRGPLTDFAT
jgi:hypothetical protein